MMRIASQMLLVAAMLTVRPSAWAAAELKVGEAVSGFRVAAVTELPEFGGRLWRMAYEKNGADLVWLDCEDENRAFVVSFRTIPSDDTGVAHIMEHSVLCGSEKYPVKEPFVELLKSSFATYLNAWTGSDCTSYPLATKNARDFLNLADVYLDAVFHPLSVKEDWAMRQEGWHYEFDGTNLTRNGVVYSEMKGAFGSPERIANLELDRLLFPDNTYGRESGGDPAHIPELTFEAYKAFYDRFYHPSNARFFLYGRIDLVATLALVDTYLRPYERRPVEVTVPRQRPVSGVKTLPYECSEKGNRTLLLDGWVTGTFDDRERQVAMGLLCNLLAGSNESPVKKALLAAGCAAYSLLWLLGDTGALFASDVVFGSFPQVAWCALLGVLMAVGGRLWVAWLNLARRVLNGRPAWVLPRMVLAGVAVGLAAWWQPHIVGNGQESIAALVGGQLGDTQQIAVLLGLKALLVAVVFGVGTMGGVLTPTLMLGCFGGYLFGVLTGAAEPLPYALVGTAAFFAVASRSPITALILVIELTLDAALIFPLMVAVAAAYATARLLPAGSLYDASVGGAADSPFEGGLAGMTVADIMHRAPARLHTDAPADRVNRALRLHAGEGIPVTAPNGCYAGMLYELTAAATAGEMMQTDVRPLSPADDIPAALAVFSRTPSRCAALPVTDPATGCLCGLVSRAELYQTAALLLRKELAHPLPDPAKI